MSRGKKFKVIESHSDDRAVWHVFFMYIAGSGVEGRYHTYGMVPYNTKQYCRYHTIPYHTIPYLPISNLVNTHKYHSNLVSQLFLLISSTTQSHVVCKHINQFENNNSHYDEDHSIHIPGHCCRKSYSFLVTCRCLCPSNTTNNSRDNHISQHLWWPKGCLRQRRFAWSSQECRTF